MITANKRTENDPAYQWSLAEMFASDAEWQKAFDAVQGKLEGLAAKRGRLTQSADALLDALALKDQIGEEFTVVYSYAGLRITEDSSDPSARAMNEKAAGLYARLLEASAFFEPEILTLETAAIERFKDEKPELRKYAHYLDNLLRQREHILSPEMEELLAGAFEVGIGPRNVFEMLDNADMKFGAVKNEKGEEVELTHGRYGSLLESRDRDVRKNTFEAYYASYWKLKNTLAATYGASVKKDVFFSGARKYPSALAASLSNDNIPEDVYRNLIAVVREFLPEMHRYVRLRKKNLGLDELHIYDVYTPIVPDVNTDITYDEALNNVRKALEIMGPDYSERLERGFGGKWIDVYENEGKRSGAFSWGVYGVHPYVLLNFDGKIDDMFTLAHEMGHAMHSVYTDETQPFLYEDYSIFLAEIASTCNEALLMDYLRKHTADKAMKAYLINNFLEQFKGTIFRQTMFAEFELKAHELAEANEPLTLETLNAFYRKLCEDYFGPDMVIDDQIALEWARIPHFYNAYYVFQYATGFSAAIAFSKHILEEGAPAVAAYKEFLKGGCSVYPIDLLKKAGVDMSSPEPVREALNLFRELLNEMEGL